MCSPTYNAVPLIINFVQNKLLPLWEIHFLDGARTRATLPLAPSGCLARIPGFPPGYPSSIPGQGTRFSFKPLLTSLPEIIWNLRSADGWSEGQGQPGLTLGIWCVCWREDREDVRSHALQVDNLGVELNCGTPSWSTRISWCCEQKLPN